MEASDKKNILSSEDNNKQDIQKLISEVNQTKSKFKTFLAIILIALLTINILFVFFTIIYAEHVIDKGVERGLNAIEQDLIENLGKEIKDKIVQEIIDEYVKENYLPDDYTSIGVYVYKKVRLATVELICSNGTNTIKATGVIINNDGYVLTNAHVITYEETPIIGSNKEIKTYSNITAKLMADESNYVMDIVAYDQDSDLALIKFRTPPTKLTTVTLASSRYLNMGEDVASLGNTHGLGVGITVGVLSGIHKHNKIDALGIDKDILQGDSGGGLFNVYSEMVGIMSFALKIEGATGSRGFAISSDAIIDFIDRVNYNYQANISYTLSENSH